MGTKYIVEVEDKPFELLSEDGFTSEKLFRVKGFNSLVFDWNGLNMLTPYTEPDLEQIRKEGYQEGYRRALADVREEHVCQTCVYFEQDENEEPCVRCPRNFLDQYTPKPKQEQEEIKVGDEVEAAFGKATVTETTEKHVYYFYADGSYGFDEKEHVTKTGRHFPEIATVLEKIKEADNG